MTDSPKHYKNQSIFNSYSGFQETSSPHDSQKVQKFTVDICHLNIIEPLNMTSLRHYSSFYTGNGKQIYTCKGNSNLMWSLWKALMSHTCLLFSL